MRMRNMRQLLAAGLFFSLAAAEADKVQFVGQWQCHLSYMGSIVSENRVSFESSGIVIIGDQRFNYSVPTPGILRLQNQSGVSDYEFEIANRNLTLRYQDGSSFNCSRTDAMGDFTGGRKESAGGDLNQFAEPGKDWQLQGSYCNWSGSSSSYSSTSSSSTRRINFDGQGHWSFGSESSFSGAAGQAYGAQNNLERGRYRLMGNQIYYSSASGEQGIAEVNMRQSNGHITEIMVDGNLYATQLCE
jgi:hypothetical protein